MSERPRVSERPLRESTRSSRANARDESIACQRCGFGVAARPFGCKNPCPNCGTIYPLGDCSD